LAVEQTDPGMMEQGPRDKKEPLIERVMLTGITIQTFVLTSSCLAIYIVGLYWNTGTWNGSSEGYELSEYARLLRKAQTMTIIYILFAELLRAHTCRSLRVSIWSMGLFSNLYMHAAVGVAISATLILALVPWFQGLFGLETLEAREWYVALCCTTSIYSPMSLQGSRVGNVVRPCRD
jgi:Ca2+-transporting ATPase